LTAQETATLRGSVVAAETGDPLPYALIRVDPAHDRLFSDERGVFVIPGIIPGSYRLIIRQVGYRPYDSTLVIGMDSPPLRIELVRLVVELTSITVDASERCRQPGPPTPAARAVLVNMFQQISYNAQRHALLQDRYPFHYSMERERSSRRRNGRVTREVDTLIYQSDVRWPYEPGRVIEDSPTGLIGEAYKVNFPILADLADSLFQATHCFYLAGFDTLAGGGPWIRMDFRVSESIQDPDVDGSIYLDPATYHARGARITVTRVSRAVRGVRSFTAVVVFRELLANLFVVDRMIANTALNAGTARSAVISRQERKRLLDVAFLRARPGVRDSVP